MAVVTERAVEGAIPAIKKAVLGLENGIFVGTVHQGQITVVKGYDGDRDRIASCPACPPSEKPSK